MNVCANCVFSVVILAKSHQEYSIHCVCVVLIVIFFEPSMQGWLQYSASRRVFTSSCNHFKDMVVSISNIGLDLPIAEAVLRDGESRLGHPDGLHLGQSMQVNHP